MAGLTDSYENYLANFVFGGVVFTPPTTWFIGLLNSAPAEDGSNVVEPSTSNGYARVAVANNITQWPSAVAGAKSNANPIIFPTATGAGWGTVTYYGFFDSLLGGIPRAFAQLDTPRIIAAGDGFQFLAGDCKISFD